MPQNPSLEDLESLQVQDLGVFRKEDKLFCKTYDQAALKIKIGDYSCSDYHWKKGIHPESFQKLLKAIQEEDKDINLIYGNLLRQYTDSNNYTIRDSEQLHIKNSLATNPVIFKTWNEKLIATVGAETTGLQDKVNSFGSICFIVNSLFKRTNIW